MEFFLSDAPGLLTDIRTTIADGDGKALEFVAHRLKGLAASFDALDVVEDAGMLEQMGHQGRLHDTSLVCDRLEASVAELATSMKEYISPN